MMNSLWLRSFPAPAASRRSPSPPGGLLSGFQPRATSNLAMEKQTYEFLIEIHRNAEGGSWTIGEHSLTPEEIQIVAQAQQSGLVDCLEYEDIGTYYQLSLTPAGRDQAGLPMVQKTTISDKLCKFLLGSFPARR